jgi:hypothetical protein
MTSNTIDEISGPSAPQHNRHFPRLCGSCGAPMARQEDTCWHCGAVWHDPVVPSDMTVTPGVIPAPDVSPDEPRLSVPAAPPSDAMRPDTARWADEGGSRPPEAPTRASVPAGAHG